MKNWAMIAIFLAAMVFSAAAQQPLKSQSAIINPGEPSTIASEKPVLQTLTGTLKGPDPQPRPDLPKLTEDLTEHQRELIEGHNQQLKEHFAAQQQAGGWQRVFLKQLALQRLELPNATLQLNAAQRFIRFCFLWAPAYRRPDFRFPDVRQELSSGHTERGICAGAAGINHHQRLQLWAGRG